MAQPTPVDGQAWTVSTVWEQYKALRGKQGTHKEAKSAFQENRKQKVCKEFRPAPKARCAPKKVRHAVTDRQAKAPEHLSQAARDKLAQENLPPAFGLLYGEDHVARVR
jgi:hypothetical protein